MFSNTEFFLKMFLLVINSIKICLKIDFFFFNNVNVYKKNEPTLRSYIEKQEKIIKKN